MNYHNKRFRPVQNSANAETSEETVFLYQQEGDLLHCSYLGGQIKKGHLLGRVAEDGAIEMVYHQVNREGELKTGICQSIPEILPNGKIRLYESWQWTSGDRSTGKSILEEL